MSPKGHFCTLSLLKRNKAASWDEQKKKIPSLLTLAHWRALCHFWCLYFGAEFKCKEIFPEATSSSSSSSPAMLSVVLWYCLFVSGGPIPSRPSARPYSGKCKPTQRAAGASWIFQRQWVVTREKGRLCYSRRSIAYSAAITAAGSNKDSVSPLPCGNGTHPLAQERRKHSIILKYSLGCTLQRACFSNGVLRRPICLADHCLSDMAANVTFLFQSKTQQGVPSVWHRP